MRLQGTLDVPEATNPSGLLISQLPSCPNTPASGSPPLAPCRTENWPPERNKLGSVEGQQGEPGPLAEVVEQYRWA